MIATFVIFLRETVEAALVVAMLLAYLDRVKRRDLFRDVFLGVITALGLAGIFGVVAYETIRTYAGSRVQTIFETATYILACSILTYMTFWMRSHAKTISKDLARRAGQAIDGRGRIALFLLSFQSVGREGVETVVFTLAILFAQSSHYPLLGGLAGLVVGLSISLAIFKYGKKMDIGKFFTVAGTVLIFFAAGLLSDVIENLNQLGWITLFNQPIWNTSSFLAESSAFGDVLHSLVGYAQQPSILQAIVYIGYLSSAVYLFVRVGSKRRSNYKPEDIEAVRTQE